MLDINTVNPREVGRIVSEALERAQAAQPGAARATLQDDLAYRITQGLIPTLRATYLDMTAMQQEWQEKRFQAALAAVATNGQLLAGYNYQTWSQLGMLMLALQTWLETPIPELGGMVPKDALLRRYSLGEDVAPAPEVPVMPAPFAPLQP